MRIVLDSNVFFSALIKDSFTRRLILEYNNTFLFPEIIFKELIKHKDILLKKSGLNQKDFSTLITLLLTKVELVEESDLHKHKEEALNIVKNIDVNDVLFIACALAFPNSILWSDDKALKKQSNVKVIGTNEIHSFL